MFLTPVAAASFLLLRRCQWRPSIMRVDQWGKNELGHIVAMVINSTTITEQVIIKMNSLLLPTSFLFCLSYFLSFILSSPSSSVSPLSFHWQTLFLDRAAVDKWLKQSTEGRYSFDFQAKLKENDVTLIETSQDELLIYL